ncbi:hypothetical protein TNCV_3746391 [Trichonephila clavipes]|nr:hypothetical protein TNCV_3746391 [Trichonephila clavipes]
MHFAIERLFYEENREMFEVLGKSSQYRDSTVYLTRFAFPLRHMPRAQKIGGRKKGRKFKLQRTYHSLTNHEKSISALQTEMLSTMEKEMLNSLMLLYPENCITMGIDYNDVINDFVMIKAQKKHLFVQVQ